MTIEETKVAIGLRDSSDWYDVDPDKLAEYLKSLEARIEKLEGEDQKSVSLPENLCPCCHQEKCTVKEINPLGNCTCKIDQKSVWEPSAEDLIWYITPGGEVNEYLFNRIRGGWDFLGVYPTREEAEAMRDKIKACVQSLK